MNFWQQLHFNPIQNPVRFAIDLAIGTALFVGLMILFHRLTPRGKKYLIIACTFIAGLFTVAEFLLPTYQSVPAGVVAISVSNQTKSPQVLVVKGPGVQQNSGIIQPKKSGTVMLQNAVPASYTLYVQGKETQSGMKYTLIVTRSSGNEPAAEQPTPVTVTITAQGVRLSSLPKIQNFLTPFTQPVNDFLLYILVWTIGLGLISLTIVHGRRLLRRASGWHNSLAFFLAMLAMLVVGFASLEGQTGMAAMKNTYDALFYGLLVNLDAAVFALLAFYIASAAYRAFRVRTIEAALLMLAALIVMLGFVSFGVKLTNWIAPESPLAFFRIERLSSFVMNWLNMPGYRAVVIGVSVGALAMAMRIWLSLERGAFFSQES